jgi:hypothetical protein
MPGFNKYPPPPESCFGFLNVWGGPNNLSTFAKTVLYGRYDIFGEPVMEATINFKWRKFAKTRYIIFIVLYFLYLASFMITVTLDSERVDGLYQLIILLSCVVLLLGIAYLGLELMQLVRYGFYIYVRSIYNWIELASIILPIMNVLGVFTETGESRRHYVGASMFFVYVNFVSIDVLLR